MTFFSYARSAGLITVLLLLLSAPIAAQQPPIVDSTEAIAFDYLTADLTEFTVTSFEAQWDGGGWTSLGMPEAFQFAETPPGAFSFKVLPVHTSGTHSLSVRAVNSVGPGGGSVPFAFALAGSVPASAPINMRVVPR